jgi:hypothetical protein
MRTIRNGNRPFPLISPASPYLSYQGYVCTLASPQSRLRSPRCPRFMILPICLFFFLIYILLNFHSFLSLPNSNFCHVLRTSCTRNSRIPEADKVKSLPPISWPVCRENQFSNVMKGISCWRGIYRVLQKQRVQPGFLKEGRISHRERDS